MSIECEKVGGINLAQGVCDTPVPEPVLCGAEAALRGGVNSYTRYDGLSELRSALAKKLAGYNRLKVDPEREITVSAGSTGAFYCVCLALLNPGDEVILFEPFYGYHLNTLLAVEAVPRFVRMSAPDWTFDPEDLERVVSPRTRAIMINTPGNPSGKIFSQSELECISDFAVRHDLFVFTDEIYEYFVYDGAAHISPGAIPAIADRTITISGFSKTYSITGWRIGYSVARERWAQMIGYMNDLIYVCAPSPLQMGVAAGISELGQDFYQAVREQYQVKRNTICSALRAVGLEPCVPRGAYYVLADAQRLPGSTSKAKAMFLLDKTGIAGVPGDAFFHNGGGSKLIRFCFAKDSAQLDDACERLQKLSACIGVAAGL